jgi:hypothetical protein
VAGERRRRCEEEQQGEAAEQAKDMWGQIFETPWGKGASWAQRESWVVRGPVDIEEGREGQRGIKSQGIYALATAHQTD